jgi:phage FluMu protein Com
MGYRASEVTKCWKCGKVWAQPDWYPEKKCPYCKTVNR